MGEPYVIRLLVEDGEPDGVRTATRQNWNGKAVAFPRAEWPKVKSRPEFQRTGIYVLVGPSDNTDDGIPAVYIGEGDAVGSRIGKHFIEKDFWDFGVAVIAEGIPLNAAQARWLEHKLIDKATELGNCHLNNGNSPGEPVLAEWDLVETKGFFRKILEMLPLLGVNAFDDTALPVKSVDAESTLSSRASSADTVVVPAQEEGFREVFIGEDSWYAIKIGSEKRRQIKYIAAYQTAPVSAVTHWAPVKSIDPIEGTRKCKLVFSEKAKELEKPIQFGDAIAGSMQGPRYTSFEKLFTANSVRELFES